MSRLGSSFGNRYYGGGDPYQVDPNLAFQAMNQYDRARLAERMSSPIYQADQRNRRAAEDQSRRFLEQQDAIQAARLEADARDRMFQQAEDAKRMEFQRQQALVQQQAENQWDQSRQQMTLQHNLGVMNADAARLDARDARSYQLRHPYLPGQSPGEQSDIRMNEFGDQQEWQIAQKLLDQNIRKEDRFETIKNQHMQEGWSYSPEDQQVLQKLESEVVNASRKVMSGEITKGAFGKYVEQINKMKAKLFPTVPPQWATQSGRALGSGLVGNEADQKDYISQRNKLQDDYVAYSQEYGAEGDAGPAPRFSDFLQQRIGTLPSHYRQRLMQDYPELQRPNITPQGAGNETPPRLGGISRPDDSTGQSVPTPNSQSGGKRQFDQAMQPSPEEMTRRAQGITATMSRLMDGSHPVIQNAMKMDSEQAIMLRDKAVALLQGYQQQPNEETWREIQSTLVALQMIKPRPSGAQNVDQARQRLFQGAPGSGAGMLPYNR